MEKMYHIGFDDSHGARYALLPGDPGRVEQIALNLDNPRFFHQNREYTAWVGYLQGERVLVMSTGIGGPSTAIAAEELFKTGVNTFIRVGTCGGMADEIKGGDVVIANAAIRMEGTSREYVPIEFPAVANLEVTNALVKAAEQNNSKYHVGIVQSKDSFYGQHAPELQPVGYDLLNKWGAWIKAGCLASEMESAALYIVSQVLRARAGCALHVIWNKDREKKGLSNPMSYDTNNVAKIATDAVSILIQQDMKKRYKI
jgi:uridine phosphorylase